MPVAVVAAVGAALVAYVLFAMWQGRLVTRALRNRACSHCGEALEPLTPGPGVRAGSGHPRSYEVWGCGHCRRVVTTLHGARSSFAYCPSCRQLSLELGVRAVGEALPPTNDPPGIEIDEACQICGYAATVELDGIVASVADTPDNVIQFPRG